MWERVGRIKENPVRELRFNPKSQSRFDFAWPSQMVAVEVEGGVWIRGRHNTGRGFISDCRKYNSAAEMGWIVLRYTPEDLKGERLYLTLEQVACVLEKRMATHG